MLNHHQHHGCDELPPLSPKSRRRAEFTIKQLQSGVMGRARSTITSLTDIWKSKIDSKFSSPPATRRTLDVMNVWSRQRRAVSATRTFADSSIKCNTFDDSIIDNRQRYDAIHSNLNCFNETTGSKKLIEKSYNVDEVRHHQSINGRNMKENGNKLSTSQKLKNKYLSRFSRTKSFELDDLLVENLKRTSQKTTSSKERRLSDGKLNNLEEFQRIISPKEKRHRSWYVTQSDDDYELNRHVNGKAPVPTPTATTKNTINYRPTGNKQTIVKARLKLQKVHANDDIILNRTTDTMRPSILQRQNSAQPLLRVESVDDNRNEKKSKTTIFKKSSTIDETAQKPRKKLSFREPIISSEFRDKKRSKTVSKAEQILQKYEREKPFARNELELSELELEVKLHGNH